jgi:hypothetical protein
MKTLAPLLAVALHATAAHAGWLDSYPYRDGGSDRRNFIVGTVSGCVKTPDMVRIETTLAYVFCACAAEDAADNITQAEATAAARNPGLPSSLQSRIKASQMMCAKKLGLY